MEKEEVVEFFLNNEVSRASSTFVLSAMSHLKKEVRMETIRQFTEDIQSVIRLAGNKQVFILQISCLQAKALSGEPFFLLEAFDQNFYLSEPLSMIEMNLPWLYEGYETFRQNIRRESRRYIQKIDRPELDRIGLAQLYSCQRIVRHLCQASIVYLLQTEEWKGLNPKNRTQFQLGEYRGAFEILFSNEEWTGRLGELWYGLL